MEVQTFDLNGTAVTLETGHIARQANGAVLLRQGQTAVLATVVFAKGDGSAGDFVPLSVDYREKLSAVGRIPGGWGRREGRQGDHEILTSRVIDRSLRPLLPIGVLSEIVVTVTVFGAELAVDLEPLAVTAASAAIAVSGLPWRGPSAAIRVCRVEGELTSTAPEAARARAELDWLVSSTREGVVMLEGGAAEVTNDEAMVAIEKAVADARPALDAISRLAEAAGRPTDPGLLAAGVANVRREEDGLATPDLLESAFAADGRSRKQILDTAGGGGAAWKELVRGRALDGRRMGGRGLGDVRAITAEIGFLPACHGSALFTRGHTQALVTATVGGPDEGLVTDTLLGRRTERFMLQYNFPSFSVGEARASRGPGRREIGHGALARRALLPVMPDESEWPQAIRVVSDILESDGSSSMATVCGATLALVDAGVPLRRPVAGVAMGAIVDGGGCAVLTDISGEEDHVGDFDFKVAGTSVGLTALQLDNKLGVVPVGVLAEAVAAARVALDQILTTLAAIVDAGRAEGRCGRGRQPPRLGQVRVPVHRIGALIGAGGKTVQELQAATHTRIDIRDDGLVRITAQSAEDLADATARVEALTMELEIGATYVAEVVSLKDFGAFVRIGGHEGLVHVSELAATRTERVADVVEVGQKVEVKVLGSDEKGRLRLSRKAALLAP